MWNKIFIVFHVFIGLLALFLIYFMSNFSIGSCETNAKPIHENPTKYFFVRLLCDLIIWLIPFILILLANRFLFKKYIANKIINRSYLIQFFVFILFSIIFITIRIFEYSGNICPSPFFPCQGVPVFERASQ